MTKSIRVGTRSHQLMVGIWLVTTSALLILLAAFGLSPAAGDDVFQRNSDRSKLDVAVPEYLENFPTARYGGQYWSISQVRHTPADLRPCAVDFSLVCNSVVVVEVLVTNTNDAPILIGLKDVGLKFPSGVVHQAQRFDCAQNASGQSLKSEISELVVECPQSEEDLWLESNQTKLLSVLFVPDSAHLPSLSRINFHVVAAHKPSSQPALIPLEGDPLTTPYPIKGKVALENASVLLENPDIANKQIVIEPKEVRLSKDYRSNRAVKGYNLALFEVSIQRSSESEDSSFFNEDYWKLETGEKSLAPELLDIRSIDDEEIVLQFSVPTGIKDLKLIAGTGNNKTVFPVVFE